MLFYVSISCNLNYSVNVPFFKATKMNTSYVNGKDLRQEESSVSVSSFFCSRTQESMLISLEYRDVEYVDPYSRRFITNVSTNFPTPVSMRSRIEHEHSVRHYFYYFTLQYRTQNCF